MPMTQAINKDVIRQVAIPSVLINLLSLAVPLTVLQIYDRILPNQSYGTATLLILGATTAVLLEAFIRYVRSWLLSAAASNTERNTYVELVKTVFSANSNELRMLGASGVDNGLSSIAKVREWYSGGIVSGFIDLPFALLFLALVFYIGGSLVLVPIVVWAIASVIVWSVSIRSKELGKLALEKEQVRKGFMLLLGQTLQSIKRQAVESRLYSQFKHVNDIRFLSKASEEQQNAFAMEFIQLASIMTSLIIVVAGSLWVLNGQLTTGGLAACSILAGRAVAPLSALIGLRVKLNTVQTANQAIKALSSLKLKQKPKDAVLKDNITDIKISDLKVERFKQQYAISLDLQPSDITLLTSDERHIDSFIASSIAGIDCLSDAELSVNNVPCDFESLNSVTAYVGAKSSLVCGSLLDNLSGFDPERTERARDYAFKLGLKKKITQLNNGLETRVGHTSANVLSAGTIKLINIAAQLSSNAKVIILDKPDASLDLDSLEALIKVLQEEKLNNRIILLVSHHPRLTQLANKVVHANKVAWGGETK